MGLTSNDETDLLLPLFRDAAKSGDYVAFLERVRRRAAAESVSIILRMRREGGHRISALASARSKRLAGREPEELHEGSLDPARYDQLRPGRVYSSSEFVDHDPVLRNERLRAMAAFGIADERIIRLSQLEQADAWIVLACAQPCRGEHSALLSALAPYVEAALRCHLALEQQRTAAAISAQGMAHGTATWMTLDPDGRITDIEPRLSAWIAANLPFSPAIGARLELQAKPMRHLISAIAALQSDSVDDGLPVVLHELPRLEALLTRVRGEHDARFLAVCQLPHERGSRTIERLAALHGLPYREAELAIALNDGQSIASAAEAMGLSIETARNYSKRIYAKLGVRGQAELTRLICDSVAVLG